VAKDAAGKRAARQLTKENYHVAEAGVGGFDWSPDGKTIAFTHTRTPKADDWPSADLSLLDVSSGNAKPLANTPAAEFSPLYSPDGQWIAFVASDNPPSWGTDQRVHVVPAQGGTPRALAETFDRQPGSFGGSLIGWSADGKK